MKVTGSAVLHAPRDRVWAALNDPAVLVRTIPGCQQLEQVGPDAYRATVTAGVASIKGTYSGNVRLSDQAEPDSFILHAAGSGVPGTVTADVMVTLADADGGGTRLDYDADAVVGGAIGGVGQRMLAGVAKKTAGEFFSAVDDVLTGRAAAPAAAPEAAGVPAAAGIPVPAVAPVGTVFTAPQQPRQPVPVGVILAAAVVGALIALAGVLVGWAIA
jgi:carbon monoxide dehydrogenase subunit G